jgi:hypothetical protein
MQEPILALVLSTVSDNIARGGPLKVIGSARDYNVASVSTVSTVELRSLLAITFSL